MFAAALGGDRRIQFWAAGEDVQTGEQHQTIRRVRRAFNACDLPAARAILLNGLERRGPRSRHDGRARPCLRAPSPLLACRGAINSLGLCRRLEPIAAQFASGSGGRCRVFNDGFARSAPAVGTKIAAAQDRYLMTAPTAAVISRCCASHQRSPVATANSVNLAERQVERPSRVLVGQSAVSDCFISGGTFR